MTSLNKRVRPQKTEFISRADSADLRSYQNLASKFPPLRHEQIVVRSRTFIEGRNAEISLDEADIINSILSGLPISNFEVDERGRLTEYKWSDEDLLANKDDILHAYENHIKWLNEKTSNIAILKMSAAGMTFQESVKSDLNIFAAFPWLSPVHLSDIIPEAFTMPDARLEQERFGLIAKLDKTIAKIRPANMLKDVSDRWKVCLSECKDHFLAHVRTLPVKRVARRRAARKIEAGNIALEEIINHNLQLAMSRVGKYMKSNQRAQQIGVADLIGAANMGLVLGARQFDPEMGNKFSTYAAYHIDGQLLEILAIEDGKSGIKGLSPHEKKQLGTITSVRATFRKIYHRVPTISELQSVSGISRAIIEKRLAAPKISTQSINAPVKNKADGDDSIMLSEIIASDKTVDSEVAASDMLKIMEDLKIEIRNLPPIHRRVIAGKTGISLDANSEGSTKTLKALAEELGISTNEVNTRYHDALATLRKHLEQRGWEPDALPFLDIDD